MKTLLSQFAFKLRFAAALIVAALFLKVSDREGLLRILRFIKLWRSNKSPDAYVSEQHYHLRLATCERCPIFYKPLRTCGTPLKKSLRDLGCWCFLPVKARLRAATCWLNDEIGSGNEYGWRE